ncbi:hypothetical protein QBC39DRAFT_436232 [Podospora conica]|nr:hypothetical protein QBC39DRAFT_436232 [Schizothecium conicum]
MPRRKNPSGGANSDRPPSRARPILPRPPGVPHGTPYPSLQPPPDDNGGDDDDSLVPSSTPAPSPAAAAWATSHPAPSPATDAWATSQYIESLEFTVTILAPNGSNPDWFKPDGEVPASDDDQNASPQEDSEVPLDDDPTAFGTLVPTYQGTRFELDVSALRQASKNCTIGIGFVKANAKLKVGLHTIEAGSCKAVLLERGTNRRSFWQAMAETSPRAFRLAYDLLDRHGHLQASYHQNDFHRGSGLWGPELGRGHILIFEDITLLEVIRGKGARVGQKLVAAVMEKVGAVLVTDEKQGQQPDHAPFYAFIKPDSSAGLGETLDAPGIPTAPESINAPGLERFWHSSGFTRVGSSPWSACAGGAPSIQPDPASPPDWSPPTPQLHHLPRPDTADKCFSDLFKPKLSESEDHGLDEMMIIGYKGGAPLNTTWFITLEDGTKIPYPAAADLVVPSGIRRLQAEPQLATAVNNFGLTPRQYLINNPVWSWADSNGNNVLHIAALTSRPETTADIMAIRPELSAMQNNHGYTPLGALRRQLDLQRRWPVWFDRGLAPARFEGFSEATMRCIALLTSGLPPYDELAPLEQLRLKYGCTCGLCEGGYLSPRTRKVFLKHAKSFLAVMAGSEWMKEWNREVPLIGVLPCHTAEMMIMICLEDKARIPDVVTVKAEWQHDGCGQGGDIERPIRRVGAKMLSNASDSGDLPQEGEWPRCANDYDFGLVADLLGYGWDATL